MDKLSKQQKKIQKNIDKMNRDRQKQEGSWLNPKKTKVVLGLVVFCSMMYATINWFSRQNKIKNNPIDWTSRQIEIHGIEEQFNSFTEEHKELKKIAEKSLQPTQTYKHIDTSYFISDKNRKHITVIMYYSGANASGAIENKCLTAVYTFYGQTINPPATCY